MWPLRAFLSARRRSLRHVAPTPSDAQCLRHLVFLSIKEEIPLESFLSAPCSLAEEILFFPPQCPALGLTGHVPLCRWFRQGPVGGAREQAPTGLWLGRCRWLITWVLTFLPGAWVVDFPLQNANHSHGLGWGWGEMNSCSSPNPER